MPKPKNKFDQQHLLRIARLVRQINLIYTQAAKEAAAIGVSIDDFDPDKIFTFSDYPQTKQRVDALMQRLHQNVEFCVVNGVNSEWTLANNKNNELCNQVFGSDVGRLTEAQYRRYYTTNETARDAFLQRKEAGLNLSDRVWKYTDEFKDEIELGIDLGLRGGLSADEMAKDLKQYLQHPDMLFRRVRDEHGILHLSKRAADFHPGRGVYRSSYMNARRLAATESNIAFRTSDHLRWQQMDFVVGIEVHLSNNHTCKGKDGKPHPFYDICDTLAGRYPKDFKFTGWHPHCRCYATTILKTDKEIDEDTQKILAGEPLDGQSENTVNDVPEEFKTWVKDNEERISGAKSLPYFLKDNPRYWASSYSKEQRKAWGIPVRTKPVRTEAEKQRIREAWWEHKRKDRINRIAEARHAQRDDQAVLQRLQERRERYAKIEARANAAITMGDAAGFMDTQARLDEVKQLLSKYRLADVDAAVAQLEKEVAEINAKAAQFDTLIPNSAAALKTHSVAEMQGVYDAVEAKIASWSSLPLNVQISKAKFEYDDFLNGNMKGVQAKFPHTWELSRDAYEKFYNQKLTEKKFIDKTADVTKVANMLKAHPKSKKLQTLYGDIQTVFNDKTDIDALNKLLDDYDDLVSASGWNKGMTVKTKAFGTINQKRRDKALWDKEGWDADPNKYDDGLVGGNADKALRPTAEKTWRGAPQEQRDMMYEYTHHYSDKNEPLEMRHYLNSQTRAEWERKVNLMTDYIDGSSLPQDMWFQRGDDNGALVGRLTFAGGSMPANLQDLIGMEIQEGGFMSAGSAKGKGFDKDIIFNIFAPKGTKAAYAEPFSAFGHGSGKSWDGVTGQTRYSGEFETIFQRGTKMKIIKVEQVGRKIYIDVDIIGQEVRTLDYVPDDLIGY